MFILPSFQIMGIPGTFYRALQVHEHSVTRHPQGPGNLCDRVALGPELTGTVGLGLRTALTRWTNRPSISRLAPLPLRHARILSNWAEGTETEKQGNTWKVAWL